MMVVDRRGSFHCCLEIPSPFFNQSKSTNHNNKPLDIKKKKKYHIQMQEVKPVQQIHF